MTPREGRPYTFPVIRPLCVISFAALVSACATDTASRAELTELTASVRALRAENTRLEARLDKLEQRAAVSSVHNAAAKPAVTAAPATSELPSLTVVKLKPKKESAPKISTDVSVVEPPEGMVDELKGSEGPLDEAQGVVADQQYARGIDALKTGNTEGGIVALQQFATDWPRHPNADNALYFAGLGRLASKDYDGAAKIFEQTATRYPAGDVVLDAMLKLAECRLKLNRPQEAKATWEKIITTFPGTAAATQAQARLASLSSP